MSVSDWRQKEREDMFVRVFESLARAEEGLKELCKVVAGMQTEDRYKLMEVYALHGFITGIREAMEWYLPKKEDINS